MKFKVFILSVISLLIFLVSPVYSAEQIAGADTLADIYQGRVKFTSITALDQSSVLKSFGVTYYTSIVEEEEQMYIQLKCNGENIFDACPIQQSGYGTGYYYFDAINPQGNYILKFKYWTGEYWSSIGGNIDYLLGTQENITVGFPPSDPGDPATYIKGKLMITEPPYDGYKVSTKKYWVQYRYGVPLSSAGAPGGASISGVGVVTGTHEVHSWYVDESGSQDYVYKYYRVQVDLEPGINIITATLNYCDETYEDSATIEYLTGIVDENNDGIDDRTQLPISGGDSGLTKDGSPVLPANATIFDYIKYAVDSVIYVFAQGAQMISSLFSSTGDIGRILTTFFGFMPAPFTGIIIIGLFIAIILRIFGR